MHKIKGILWALFFFCSGFYQINGQRLSRDLCVDLLTNHLGYLPGAVKICLAPGNRERSFEVIETTTQKIVFTGVLKPDKGDFGEFLVGDLSQVKEPGVYYLKSDTLRSYPFVISTGVYEKAMTSILEYFAMQRCGASTTGYLSPCHLDDGIRLDNGKHKDVSGGWHDASDLRKWVSATIYGMIGLEKGYELTKDEVVKKRIADELRWGNSYFLKMQEPDGFIMDFIGGDLWRNLDNNRWTDNVVGEDGGEAKLVRPNSGLSTSLMLTMGPKDDRVIQTRPADLQTQFRFSAAEAEMYNITLPFDSVYAGQCLNAAAISFKWGSDALKKTSASPEVFGTAIQAAITMYKITGQDYYLDFAVRQADSLKALQSSGKEKGVEGFFVSSADSTEPFRNILGSAEFIALCDLAITFPKHAKITVWKNMIEKYTGEYLLPITQKNSFGLVPLGLYEKEDPGGDRKIGAYWYRYFMQPELSWWVGINANIASAGIGLFKAGNILKNKKLLTLAQRQLDWICGNNPFNSCTIVGIGYNNPPRYIPSAFIPRTPVLTGAVMNGLGGDHLDQPFIGEGIWQISEYWTPMTALTFWLMAELKHQLN